MKEAFASAHKVSSKSDKKKALEGDVIITTSGMLDGGPSLWYLNRLRHDLKNEIFMVLDGFGGSDAGVKAVNAIKDTMRISI